MIMTMHPSLLITRERTGGVGLINPEKFNVPDLDGLIETHFRISYWTERDGWLNIPAGSLELMLDVISPVILEAVSRDAGLRP